MRIARLLAATILAATLPGTALAGPPYATDDPVPTDTGKWEIYAFADAAFDLGTSAGSAGLDLNYGPIRDVQLTATLPFEFDNAPHTSTRFGDAELGIKWRLLNDERHGRSLAIFPRAILPTTRGPGKVELLLPAWAQQDLGPWSIFGGGGYAINRGAGRRNAWQTGVAVTRGFGERLSIGGEIFHETAEQRGGHGATLIGAGANLSLRGPFFLLVAGGPIIEDHTGHTAMRGYAALFSAF